MKKILTKISQLSVFLSLSMCRTLSSSLTKIGQQQGSFLRREKTFLLLFFLTTYHIEMLLNFQRELI